MKKMPIFAVLLAVCVLFCACNAPAKEKSPETVAPYVQKDMVTKETAADATKINLSDAGITVDGVSVSADETAAVYIANDIVFYPEGKDFTYGEGTKEDEHSQEEADAHTVVHITQPGQYILSGKLSAGQVAVDLGKDRVEDPDAVVTLVLDNVEITCTVAPAVIFYNVYECCEADEETAQMEVDTSAAGANVIIADGSTNTVRGSYVAKIYKSVELNEDGTEVVDSKKLHKYDGAFYSKRSMNIYGEKESTGVLNIYAENEGLDSELHLKLYSGNINIESGNDGINTNEDNVSVTHILGGTLNIKVTGETGEGDGIDSNGWLVIDGGVVNAFACGSSADSGIDADKGVYIRGGQVIATGNMLDRVQGDQKSLSMNLSQRQKGGKTYTLKSAAGTAILTVEAANDFRCVVLSSPALTENNYTLWEGDTQISSSGNGGPMGGMPPNGEMPGMPEGGFPEMPEGGFPGMPGGQMPQWPGEGRPQWPGQENPDNSQEEETDDSSISL